MRRSGRRGHAHDFPSSGEDSFVAVVVTKLTGALLFILLVSLVILALVPKGQPGAVAEISAPETGEGMALEITTPESLPDAVAGRTYQVGLAARGADESAQWEIAGELPAGLELDAASGVISGRPMLARAEPYALEVRLVDGSDEVSRVLRLVVLESAGDPARSGLAKLRGVVLPRLSLREWAEHGVGFVLIGLVAWVGLGTIDGLERRRQAGARGSETGRFRFVVYRAIVGCAGFVACGVLAVWLVAVGLR